MSFRDLHQESLLLAESSGELKGIVMVAHLSLGGKFLVFRYPSVERKSLSVETREAYLRSSEQDQQRGPGLRASRDEHQSSAFLARKQKRADAALRYFDAYQLPSVLIAPMLLPKRALLNCGFALDVDSLSFVGWPLALSQRDAVVRIRQNLIAPSSSSSDVSSIGHGWTPLASLQRQYVDGLNAALSGAIDDSNFLYDVNDDVGNNDNDDDEANGSDNDDDDADGEPLARDCLLAFNVVFTLTDECDDRMRTVYQSLARQLCGALRHEQDRCDYLRHQLTMIQRVRRQWLEENAVEPAHGDSSRRVAISDSGQHGGGGASSAFDALRSGTRHEQLTKRMLECSSLARTLRDVFAQLKRHRQAQVCVNDWLRVSLSLTLPTHVPAYPMRPYQTLLLIVPILRARADEAKVHGHARASSSSSSYDDVLGSDPGIMVGDSRVLPEYLLPPTLWRFVQACNPTRCFADIEAETSIPLAHIYRMAAHLVYWQCAVVIDQLTMHKVLVTGTQRLPDRGAERAFAMRFDSTWGDLGATLQRFSAAQPLSKHYESLQSAVKREFVPVVVWLLRHKLLVQLDTYVFLLIDRELSADPADVALLDSDVVADDQMSSSLSDGDSPSTHIYVDYDDESDSGESGDDGFQSPPASSRSLFDSPSATTVFARDGDAAHSSSSDDDVAPLVGYDFDQDNGDIVAISSDHDDSHNGDGNDDGDRDRDRDDMGAGNNRLGTYGHRSATAPSPLLQHEIDYLYAIDDGSPTMALFRRLCPYFRGRHSIEEILWRESLPREHLTMVLEQFSDVLTLATTESMNKF
jgi:Nitrogen Permease regulator of amino acid transport activity 3